MQMLMAAWPRNERPGTAEDPVLIVMAKVLQVQVQLAVGVAPVEKGSSLMLTGS